MTYAQIMAGGKLHLVCVPGEEYKGEVIRAGYVSAPLCSTRRFDGRYRMTINAPLGHSCQNCQRVYRALAA